MKNFIAKVCLALSCWVLMAADQAYASNVDAFLKSANALAEEKKKFEVETRRLLDNTSEVENVFSTLNAALMTEHKIAQAITELDKALATTEKALKAGELVPQIKEQASQLRSNIQAAHKNIASAAKKMEAIDSKVVPLLEKTEMVEEGIAELVQREKAFRAGSLTYLEQLGKISQCTVDSRLVIVMDASTKLYSEINDEVKKLNDSYDAIKKIPEQSINNVVIGMKNIAPLELPLVTLRDSIEPLLEGLGFLQAILDKRIGVKPSYPCGVKMCTKHESVPCGVKKCKKAGIPYPCGYKTCKQKVSYPCGAKTCHASIGMTVADAINGAAAVERQVKSVLSSTAYWGLKKVGMSSVVHDLEDKANAQLNRALRKLDFSVNTKVPSLNVNFDPSLIDVAIADIQKFDLALGKFASILDPRSTTFSPYIARRNDISLEIEAALKSPMCKNTKQ